MAIMTLDTMTVREPEFVLRRTSRTNRQWASLFRRLQSRLADWGPEVESYAVGLASLETDEDPLKLAQSWARCALVVGLAIEWGDLNVADVV